MPDRPEPASQQPHRAPAKFSLRQYPPMPPPQHGPPPGGWGVPQQRPGPVSYPAIPQQWCGPPDAAITPQPVGPPPAGLSAPLPVPTTRPIRHAVLGVIVLLVLLVALGTAISSTGTNATIGQWRDNGGMDRLNALSQDLSAIGDAGKAGDLDTMANACRSLQADTAAAQAYAPIPDPQAQTHWTVALEHLARASSSCVAAVHDQDGDLFSQAAAELHAAPPEMSEVTSRLAS